MGWWGGERNHPSCATLKLGLLRGKLCNKNWFDLRKMSRKTHDGGFLFGSGGFAILKKDSMQECTRATMLTTDARGTGECLPHTFRCGPLPVGGGITLRGWEWEVPWRCSHGIQQAFLCSNIYPQIALATCKM